MAVSRGLLVALFVALFPAFVTAEDKPELGGSNAAGKCSELSVKRGQLLAQIERLRAETASVEAKLGELCNGTTQTDVGLPPSGPALSAAIRAASLRGNWNMGDPRHSQSARASTSARILLQELTPAEPACSMDELMAVQADPAAAVVGLFTTNPSCAICLVPCGSAADAMSCAMGCLKQARCPDATILPIFRMPHIIFDSTFARND